MAKKNREVSRAERAAAVVVEQQRRERRRRFTVIGGVVAVLVALVVVLAVVQSARDTTGQPVSGSEVPRGVTDTYGVVVGDPDAPTTVTVYEDFQCPACREFEHATGEALAAGIDAGRVKVDYRMVSFLDRASTNEYSSRALNAAAVVLDVAGVDAFKRFHDLLFANQPAEGTAGLSDDELIDLAVRAGAAEDQVRRPIEDGAFAQWVANTQAEMSEGGITGTPTVFIDGERAGSTVQEAVDAVLAAAG